MKVRSKFLRDTHSLQVAGGLCSLLQVGSVVLLAFLLGSAGQGQFVSACVLHAFGYCLLNVGVAQVTTSQISSNAAQGRTEKVAIWMAFITKVHVIFAGWIIVAGFLLFPWLAENLLSNRDIGVWASWLCLGSLLDIPRDVVRVALQGTRRMRHLGRVEVGQELVRFFLIASGALVTGGPGGAILGSLCASAMGSLLAMGIYHDARSKSGTSLPTLRKLIPLIARTPIRKGLRQGVRIAAFKNMHTLLFLVLPKLVVQSLAGSNWVAYFHVAQRLMSLPQILSTAISRNALPAMGELAGKRDGLGFRRLFATTTLVTGATISAAIWLLVLIVPTIVDLAFASDYGEPVLRLAVVLAIGESAAGFCVCLEAFFISTNRLRALFGFSLLGLATAVPAAIWLIGHVPLTGAAWGVVVMRSFNLVQLLYAARFLWGHGGRTDYWHTAPKPGQARA